MRIQSLETKNLPAGKLEEPGEKISISAERVWNLVWLEEEIWKAIFNFKKNHDDGFFYDRDGCRSSMIAPLSLASYYQTHEIAETLGLEYDELIMNEDELESVKKRMRFLALRLLRELENRIPLPPGFSFYIGHDPDGNFGLILQERAEATLNPPLSRKAI